MWSRRRFLTTASGLPLVGGFIGAGTRPLGAAGGAVVGRGERDYFRELGVRPFINAAGTYTAMTASLMPPEVVEAINYASKRYVMLDELHDKVGERIATLNLAGTAIDDRFAKVVSRLPALRDIDVSGTADVSQARAPT